MAVTPRDPDLGAMLAALSERVARLERPAVPAIYTGSGAPSPSLGSSGSYYLRSDTPGTANQRIYVNNAGTWVGIA